MIQNSHITMSAASRRFKVIYEIGAGAFSRVEKCLDRETGQVVALKSVPIDNSDHFSREVTLMRSLAHPNIVTFYDSFRTPTELQISMEFCANGNLASHKHKVTPDMILSIVRDVAAALSYLHSHSVIHLDIKPQNILITALGEVKLGDFGISRHADTATAAGTLLYIAPEILSGSPVSPACDIYSLGMTVFELITGVPISLTGFSSFNDWKASNAHTIDPRILAILNRTLCTNPSDRATAESLLQLLQDTPETWRIAMKTASNWITPKSRVFWEDELTKT